MVDFKGAQVPQSATLYAVFFSLRRVLPGSGGDYGGARGCGRPCDAEPFGDEGLGLATSVGTSASLRSPYRRGCMSQMSLARNASRRWHRTATSQSRFPSSCFKCRCHFEAPRRKVRGRLAPVFLFCFFQIPPHSTSLPRGERPRTRCVGAIGFALGSTVMSRSKVKVEMEPTPLAVSKSALVNLMQFVVIASALN